MGYRVIIVFLVIFAVTGDVSNHLYGIIAYNAKERTDDVLLQYNNSNPNFMLGRKELPYLGTDITFRLGPMFEHRYPYLSLEYRAPASIPFPPDQAVLISVPLLIALVLLNAAYVLIISYEHPESYYSPQQKSVKPLTSLAYHVEFFMFPMICLGFGIGWAFLLVPSHGHFVEVLQHALLLTTYCLWMFTDIVQVRDFRRLTSNRQRAAESAWIFVDVFIIAVLVWSVVMLLIQSEPFVGMPFGVPIGMKDIAISSALVGWVLKKLAVDVAEYTKYYPDHYSEYLSQIAASPPVFRTGSELATILPNPGTLKILDFGCGGGTRMVQLVTWLRSLYQKSNQQTAVPLEVDAFDKNKNWYDRWKNCHFGENTTTRWLTRRPKTLAPYDIVFGSHVAYYPRALKYLFKLFSRTASDHSLLIIRAFHPKSFLLPASVAINKRQTSWWRESVEYLARKYGLIRQCEYLVTQTHTIPMTSPLSASLFPEIMGTVVENDRVGLFIYRYLALFVSAANPTNDENVVLCNDDVVIVFRKGTSGKSREGVAKLSKLASELGSRLSVFGKGDTKAT